MVVFHLTFLCAFGLYEDCGFWIREANSGFRVGPIVGPFWVQLESPNQGGR